MISSLVISVVFRSSPYFFAIFLSWSAMSFLTSLSSPKIRFNSSRSSISFSISAVRFKIYSRFRLRSFISATYSACILSIPKPSIRFGTTSASSSVWRIIEIALSISSKIFLRPVKRCSLSLFLSMSYFMPFLTHSIRNFIHSRSMSRTPRTIGRVFISTLKLQL